MFTKFITWVEHPVEPLSEVTLGAFGPGTEQNLWMPLLPLFSLRPNGRSLLMLLPVTQVTPYNACVHAILGEQLPLPAS